jgi:CBS domain-containing protein
MDVIAVLKKKTLPVYTVSADQSVDDAINLMVAKKVNALIVTDAQRPVGVFTVRDFFQHYLPGGKGAWSDVKLKSAMTGRLVSAETTDDITDIINVMIKSDLDHLPVVEDDKILGLIDLKDLVKFQLESLTGEIHQLKDYIDDLHEAGQD